MFNKNDFKRIKNNRRYYSHRMIKKDPAVVLKVGTRTIYCNDLSSIKKTTSKHVLLLSNNFGYNVQTYIN